VSLLWTAFWMTGEREVSACGRSEPHGEVNRRGRVGVRPMTRDCRSALLPVCAVPSSLQIFFRSLLMSVLEAGGHGVQWRVFGGGKRREGEGYRIICARKCIGRLRDGQVTQSESRREGGFGALWLQRSVFWS
jgi:hypothetical protein